MTGQALIVQGDALRLPLPDASVDLVVTSPPYAFLRAYDTGYPHLEVGAEPTPALFLEHLWQATAEMVRVLKPSGSIFIDLGDSYSSGERYDNEFTLEDGAWLGGVVDSDGSISVHKQGTSYTAWVRVGQMRPEVVERIHAVTGTGTVSQDNRGCWHWQAAAKQASWVLERIWPWLHIKRRQAFAAVELQERKVHIGGKGRWNALTDDELRYRERIRQAVLAWNDGRPDDHQPPLLPLPDLPRTARWIPAKSLLLLPERYRVGCVDRLGLIARAVQIWSKPNGLPESVTDRVRRSHEDWVHLTKQPRYYSAIDEVREPQKYPDDTRHLRGQRNKHSPGAHDKGNVSNGNPLGSLPGSVWTIPSEPLSLPGYFVTQDGTLLDFLAPSRGRPRPRASSNGHGLFDPDTFAEAVAGEDAGAWRWLWANGITASPWPRTDDGLQLRTAASHYAAFPSRWPEQLIKAFSPPGICLDCGQGRVPVVDKGRLDESRPQARRAQQLADQAGLSEAHLDALVSQGTSDVGRAAATQTGTGRNTAEVQRLAAEAKAVLGGYSREFLLARPSTILGYACACTPHTNHPGSGESSGPRSGDLLDAGQPWPRFEDTPGPPSRIGTRPKVGPWREYHLDGWTPPPTRPAVVLDPFSGTGTTPMVARALGRIGVGVDLSMPYSRAAVWRVKHNAGKAISRTWTERQGQLL